MKIFFKYFLLSLFFFTLIFCNSQYLGQEANLQYETIKKIFLFPIKYELLNAIGLKSNYLLKLFPFCEDQIGMKQKLYQFSGEDEGVVVAGGEVSCYLIIKLNGIN